jgi:molecular chaperone DnaK (HSP70)
LKKINLNNNDILTKIKNEIRRLTIHLFKNEKARLLIVNLDNNNDFELEMNIKTYTTLCKDLWDKMDIQLKNIINSLKIQKKDINEFLILNESKIPRIQEVLKPYFQKEIRNIKKEYVAKGATIIGNELVKENNNL